MTNRHAKASATDLAVATEHDATAEVRAWVARRLRFEHLLASLEREAGFRGETDRPPGP